MTTMRLPFPEIRELVTRVLMAYGLVSSSAVLVADAVAGAERDGTLSHGLLRVPGYVSTLKSGWVDGSAIPIVNDTAPGLVTVDARNGFAQIAVVAARDSLISKARRVGIASLAIRNSHHFASLYADVEPLAEAGFVALAFVNSRSRIPKRWCSQTVRQQSDGLRVSAGRGTTARLRPGIERDGSR
jgi:delta1-piperideine-2-carboxylate reductase